MFIFIFTTANLGHSNLGIYCLFNFYLNKLIDLYSIVDTNLTVNILFIS